MSVYASQGSSDLKLPPDSYIYQILPLVPQTSTNAFAPVTSGSRFAALSSNNAITIIDASSLKETASIKDVSTSVTCMTRYAPLGQDCTTLITTGRDGNVRIWDLRSGSKVGEAKATLERLGAQSLSALTSRASTNVIVAGTELWEREGPGDAPIFAWDARQLSAPHHTYTESHTDTVTDLRFHPQHDNVLLTASTDGLVNLINVSETDEDEAVLQVINHKSALHHAGFICDSLVYGLGTDETLSFYHVESAEDDTPAKQPFAFGDLREALDIEYIVDLVNGADGSTPYVVGGKHSTQTLDLIPLVQSSDGWTSDAARRMRMSEAHGEEIVRDVYVDRDLVFTCGEDGKVKVWKHADAQATEGGGDERTKGKKEKKPKGKEGRYAPY